MNVCALLSLSVLSAKAQTTYMEMEQLTVNDQVTTVITASNPSALSIYPQTRWWATNPSTTPSA